MVGVTMDADTEVTGRYITSMVKSAGEVSPVFEKKMKELLSEHGIDDPDHEKWYSAEAFIEAVNQATDRIGSKTIAQAGEEMGRDVPKPEDAESPHDVLKTVDEAQQAAYRGGSEERPAGSYTYERLGDREARCAVTEDFAYPDEISEGSLRGIVKDMVDRGSDVRIEEVDPKPTDHPEKSDERIAYRISW
jgi:hypothetical protein